MITTCHNCGVNVQVDIERMAGIRYCETCRWRAKATWTLRTAALYAERAGMAREAASLLRSASRMAMRDAPTRKEILSGGVVRRLAVDRTCGKNSGARARVVA